jgi:aspartyl-tRNA synthetase, bacterial type
MEKRTDYCGALREAHVGKSVSVCGWVLTKRDMGGVIFIDLRDREGTLQVVFDARNLSENGFNIAESLRNQSVIQVNGVVRLRGEDTINPKIVTGTVEVAAFKIDLLAESENLPFPLEDETSVREDLRLKYRFLDIRRPWMLNNLRFRHQVSKIVRNYLDTDGFIEVETPVLTKSTPEGARDYLVPSRVHPGTFYALPQSPQIFKQLLMVGGIDKYYQIARCFRDEDLRADRQPEFTQVDMELSFIHQEEILVHLEKLFKYIFREMMNIDIEEAFPRITWHESMDRYGCDKPDLRFGFPIIDISEIARKCNFSVFRNVTNGGGVVRAINVKGHGDFTRSQIEYLTEKALTYGAKGMAWIAIKPDGELYSILNKYLSKQEMAAIIRAVDGENGDFILFCADKLETVRRTLGGIRLDIGTMLELRKKDDYQFCIVTDFPQFEYSEEEKRFVAMHHPFTMPYPEDVQYLLSDPGKVRAQAYDVVLNGIELGSGSIRIHDKNIQHTMFEALGFSPDEIESRFGFMINAFKYGTPPHGGFAFGLDRLVMIMVGAESLRDIIAFPKTKDASCLMTDAPNTVDRKQLEELSLLNLTDTMEDASSVAKAKTKAPIIDVENVAELSKLSLTTEEQKKMAKDMEAIISFANRLSEIDTADMPVTAHVIPMKNVFHDDIPESGNTRSELLANAPTKTEEYVYVPRVVE